MAPPVRVAMIGATGQMGNAVLRGFLDAGKGKFEVTSLAREQSIGNEANKTLRQQGIDVKAVDLRGPIEKLIQVLQGIDVVVSCIVFDAMKDQIPLAKAAKAAGVKRFVPCHFGTPAPRGISLVNDWKHEVLDAIQRMSVPYTVIDVGWWSEQATSIAPLPSGRTNAAIVDFARCIPGDGTGKCAFTSIKDMGQYVATIITDPRTLNRKVFAYTDVMSYNSVADLLNELSGEVGGRKYKPVEEIQAAIDDGITGMARAPGDSHHTYQTIVNQYFMSWGIRGDNTPEVATYLGYLDFKKLYPEVRGESTRSVFSRLLAEGI